MDTNGVRYELDTKYDGWMVLTFFMVMVLLIGILFFVTFFANNPQGDIILSRTQFDLLQNRAKIPEGAENSFATHEGFVDPKNLTVADLDSLKGYEECPENECAIDLNTGVKRCPENLNSRVVYNRAYESCTAKYFCTSEELPYAILTSGETDSFGICEADNICRCTDKVVCPKYVTGTINIRNGNNFSSRNKDLSYYFDQTVIGSDKVIGYDSIEILPSSRNREFCSVNPSYTNRITGGCNFQNTNADILGCVESEEFFSVNETKFENLYGGSEFDFGYQNNPDNEFKTESYQNYLNLTGDIKPRKGFAKKVIDGITHIVEFGEFDGNSQILGDEGSNRASNISSISVNDGVTAMESGIPSEFNNKESGDFGMDFLDIIYTGCPSSGTKNNVSNRAMLLCTQNQNQPCIEGQLTYIPRVGTDFCQDKTTTLSYIENPEKTREALDNPENITMSCVVGNGCNGDYNTSFCDDGNCDKTIDEYKDNYKTEFDSSAMRNAWVIRKSNVAIGGTITYRVENGQIIFTNDGLLKIEAGDYFSISRLSFNKLVLRNVDVVVGMTIHLGTVDGIEIGFTAYQAGFKGVITAKDADARTIQIASPTGEATVISEYTLLNVLNTLVKDDDGSGFGRLMVDQLKGGEVTPAKLQGTETVVWDDSSPETFYIFKQFGFNGLNYNTHIVTVWDDVSKKYECYRKYSPASNWAYWFPDTDDLRRTPLSSVAVGIYKSIDDVSKEELNPMIFSSANADFKKELSFYYPVWESSKNKQICVKCKPNLVAYTKINEMDGADVIMSAVIQFSGRDFSQYTFYPKLEKGNNGTFKFTDHRFCYNVFTSINGNESTSRRIVLNEINPNIPFTDDLPDDYYADNPYYLLDSSNVLRRSLKLRGDSVPPPPSVNVSFLSDLVKDNFKRTIVLEDRYLPYQFEGETLSMKNINFSLSSSKNGYVNYELSENSNLFTGKTYFDEQLELYMVSDVRITKVELINGEQVIWTDAIQGEDFPDNEHILQVLSENDDLVLDSSAPKGSDVKDPVIIPNAITDGRITELKILDRGFGFNIGALPQIKIKKYRNVE